MAAGPEEGCPQIAFWLTTEGLDAEAFSAARAELAAMVDELAPHLRQAVIGRWNWTSSHLDSTPYELACGVHGQCTTAAFWW